MNVDRNVIPCNKKTDFEIHNSFDFSIVFKAFVVLLCQNKQSISFSILQMCNAFKFLFKILLGLQPKSCNLKQKKICMYRHEDVYSVL